MRPLVVAVALVVIVLGGPIKAETEPSRTHVLGILGFACYPSNEDVAPQLY